MYCPYVYKIAGFFCIKLQKSKSFLVSRKYSFSGNIRFGFYKTHNIIWIGHLQTKLVRISTYTLASSSSLMIFSILKPLSHSWQTKKELLHIKDTGYIFPCLLPSCILESESIFHGGWRATPRGILFFYFLKYCTSEEAEVAILWVSSYYSTTGLEPSSNINIKLGRSYDSERVIKTVGFMRHHAKGTI